MVLFYVPILKSTLNMEKDRKDEKSGVKKPFSFIMNELTNDSSCNYSHPQK